LCKTCGKFAFLEDDTFLARHCDRPLTPLPVPPWYATSWYELHWQIYHSIRQYPGATFFAAVMWFNLGAAVTAIGFFTINALRGP
jgi:hypothetical protein